MTQYPMATWEDTSERVFRLSEYPFAARQRLAGAEKSVTPPSLYGFASFRTRMARHEELAPCSLAPRLSNTRNVGLHTLSRHAYRVPCPLSRKHLASRRAFSVPNPRGFL